MQANLQQFRDEARKIDQLLQAESLKSYKRFGAILLRLHKDLIKRTPLDTGMAKAGWVLTRTRGGGFQVPEGPKAIAKAAGRVRHSGMLAPYEARVEQNIADAEGRVGAGVDIFRAERASSRGTAQLAGSGLDRRRITFFISNNVDYIDALDAGTGSDQAPSGMTRPAFTAAYADLAREVGRRTES